MIQPGQDIAQALITEARFLHGGKAERKLRKWCECGEFFDPFAPFVSFEVFVLKMFSRTELPIAVQ
jgi:hypothetical protein